MQELGIKVELAGVKTKIQHMLLDHSSELQRRIVQTLEEKINETWVQKAIVLEVENCITKAVSDLADNYELRRAITEYISAELQKKLGA